MFRILAIAMTSSGSVFVAAPAMLLPADSALVILTGRDLQPRRMDLVESPAAKVCEVADYAQRLSPQFKATYLCKMFFRAPLLASQVRLEIMRRDREQKLALWRQHAKDNRSAAVKRRREAEAATKGERGDSLRPRVAAAAGQASSSSTSAAAAAGCRGPDLNAASSSGPAAPASRLPRTRAGAAANLVPGAASANAVESVTDAAHAVVLPADDTDDETALIYEELFGSGSDVDLKD